MLLSISVGSYIFVPPKQGVQILDTSSIYFKHLFVHGVWVIIAVVCALQTVSRSRSSIKSLLTDALSAATYKGNVMVDIRHCHLCLCLLFRWSILLGLSCLFMAISMGPLVLRNAKHRRLSLFPDRLCFGQTHCRPKLGVSGRGSDSTRYPPCSITLCTGTYITSEKGRIQRTSNRHVTLASGLFASELVEAGFCE